MPSLADISSIILGNALFGPPPQAQPQQAMQVPSPGAQQGKQQSAPQHQAQPQPPQIIQPPEQQQPQAPQNQLPPGANPQGNNYGAGQPAPQPQQPQQPQMAPEMMSAAMMFQNALQAMQGRFGSNVAAAWNSGQQGRPWFGPFSRKDDFLSLRKMAQNNPNQMLPAPWWAPGTSTAQM